MPAGAPTKYDQSFCEKLIEHMRQGKSFESFAATVGCGRVSLYSWLKQHPEFLNAKQQGHELALSLWEDIGQKHILNVTQHGVGSKSLNSTAWIFIMKNRFGYKDKIEHTLDPEAYKVDTSIIEE